jgi:hypothetical protein
MTPECSVYNSGSAARTRRKEPDAMSIEEIFTFLPRLFGFLVTYPIRVIFGVDFDWGIR